MLGGSSGNSKVLVALTVGKVQGPKLVIAYITLLPESVPNVLKKIQRGKFEVGEDLEKELCKRGLVH